MLDITKETWRRRNSPTKVPQKQEGYACENNMDTSTDCINCRIEGFILPSYRHRDVTRGNSVAGQRITTRSYRMKSFSVLLMTLLVTSLLPSYVMSVPLDFNLDISESESTESRTIYEIQMDGYTPEDMELSAKEFLGKFGYVKPADWNNVSPRTFEDEGITWGLDEGEESQNRKGTFEGSGFDEKEEEKERPVVTWAVDGISERQYHRALLKYQRVNGLNATGELDSDTTFYMGRPRCGVPDRTAALKANRTDELMRLTVRTTAGTTTSSTPPTPTTNSLPNSTSRISIASNLTDLENEDSATTKPTTSLNNGVPVIHSITTQDPESSGGGMELDGSGEDPDPELVRRRRSDLAEIQMEAEFDDEVLSPQETEVVDYNEVRLRQLGFKELGDGPISEAELPDESRVSDLKGILEALRQERLSHLNSTKQGEIFESVVNSIRPPPAAPVPSLIRKMVMESRMNRRKRSTVYLKKTNGWLLAFPKRVITWRLVDEWSTKKPFMTSNEIWFTVKLAFRMWSEILPRNFREDNISPMTDVDILIGFGTKVHNRCLVPFSDGSFTREYAHAWPLPQAEVHFNDDQPFVAVTWEPATDLAMSQSTTMYGAPISLLKVATHEIGHALGLPHNKDRNSIMKPVYTPYQSKTVTELQMVDRRAIQQVYGSCDITFDAVFDWVRKYIAKDGTARLKYNTYFFRKTWFWLYENRVQRPKYGDPKYSFNSWRGVLDGTSNDPHRKIDGVIHIRDWSVLNGPIYFFTGDSYKEYDSVIDRVKKNDSKANKYPRKIKEGFPGIPSPIDTAVYKMNERRIYFFKDHLVYKYDWRTEKVESIERISTAFPGWGGASPLPDNIDAAYYSYTDSAYYFFKDMFFWKLADERERYYNKGLRIAENAVGPRRLISSKWRYICDVDVTEMQK